jgi:hypothetical protein
MAAHEPPLTDDEIRYARHLIEQDRNSKYLIQLLKGHAPWIIGIGTALASAAYWLITHVTWRNTP